MDEEEAITLDDLFYDYEGVEKNGETDPIKLTSNYKEYLNEITPARLVPLPRGFFFPYQEQQARFILQEGADSLLGILDPGTGKTFIGIMISEMLRGNYDPSLPRDPRVDELPPLVKQYLMPTRTNIKRCVYLTANHILDREAIKAIPIAKDTVAMSVSDLNWYTSRTFGTFLSKYSATYRERLGDNESQLTERGYEGNVKEKAEEEALAYMATVFEQDLSDSLFIIDEAHRLTGENLNKIAKGKNINYKLIWLLIKSAKRSKTIVFTATPINNNTNEIIPIMNLVLPVDEQVPLDTDFNSMSQEAIDELIEEKLGNKTFYVSARPSGMEETYIGVPLPGTPFSYDPSELVGKQREQYLSAVKGEMKNVRVVAGDEGESSEEEDKKKREAAYQLEIMAGLCWCPVGEEVSAGGRTMVAKKVLQSIIYPPDSDVVMQIARDLEAKTRGAMVERATAAGKGEEATRRLRGKYEGDVRIVVDAPPYLFDKERMLRDYGEKPENWRIDGPKGNNLRQRSAKYTQILTEALDEVLGSRVFLIYFRYFVTGGLTAFVAIALLNGYERYDETLRDVVVGGRIVGLKKRKRLVVFTPNMKSATKELWLKIVVHPDNVNGEYINMVVISPGMKIGISIFSVQRIFHTSPEWSPWGELQSIFRGLREGGAEQVLRAREEWPDGVMDVLISLQCATMGGKVSRSLMARPRAFTQTLSTSQYLTTVDEDMYLWLADKYANHLRVLGPIRNVAVGCNSNRLRNGDLATCRPQEEGELVVDVFNNLYAKRYVWALKSYLRRVMGVMKEPLHLAEIMARTRSYNLPLQFYDRAISELIEEREPIVSEVGYPLYIGYDRQRIFLQQDYTISDSPLPEYDFLSSYYSNFVPIVHSMTAIDIPFTLTEKARSEVLSLKNEMEARSYILSHFPTAKEQIGLLETALLETHNTGEFEDWESSQWGVILRVYFVYWEYFGDQTFKRARIVHSFISFLHEAGYPIIARLQRPSRYRFYVEVPGEWTTTLERGHLVDDFRAAYSDRKVTDLFRTQTDYPIAIDTITDGQFRISLRSGEGEGGVGVRGKMIAAFNFLELSYIAILVGWFPPKSKMEKVVKFTTEDVEDELREEIILDSGDAANEVVDLVVDIANKMYKHYTRDKLASELKKEFEQQKRVLYA